MKHPLLPVAILMALTILIAESLSGCFTRWSDPMRSPSHYGHYVSETNWLRVRVCQPPIQRTHSFRVVAEVLEIADTSGSAIPCHGKVQLYLPEAPLLGDILIVKASLQQPSPSLNPHQFDYRLFLLRKAICFQAFLSKSQYRVIGHESNGFTERISAFRMRMVNTIRFSSLTPSQQGIAEALFLGWDYDLSPDTENSFQRAGIMHLLCVSGLHVGIVAMLAGWILSFLGNRRPQRIIKGCFQLMIVAFFVLLTGMAPGTMRAGLMFAFVIIGQMFFTRPPTLNAVAASAIVLLVANPLLVFDVGFQLSYCSVLGIIILYQPMADLMPIPKGGNVAASVLWGMVTHLRNLLCVSFAAQLSTAPLILYYFHKFPLYFLVANIVVIPFAALLLGSVMLLLAFSWWPWAFKVVGLILSAELSATEWVTSAVASWPHSMLQDIWFDHWMLLFTIAAVVAFGWLIIRRHWPSLTVFLCFALLIAVYGRITEIRYASQMAFDVYQTGKHTAVEFFVGHESYLLCDSVVANNPDIIDYQTSANRKWHQAYHTHILSLDTSFSNDWLTVENRFVYFNGTKLHIIDKSDRYH